MGRRGARGRRTSGTFWFFAKRLAVLGFLLMQGCHSKRAATSSDGRGRGAAEPPPPVARAESPERPQGPEVEGSAREPASQEPTVFELPVEEFFPVLVVRPGGPGPFPVWVATHGAGGLAEDHCEFWWEKLEGSHLLMCLRGHPLYRDAPERGFYYPDHLALGRELRASILVLREAFPRELTGSWTFAGYSQGATMGALALPEFVPPFTRSVFIEGGNDSWTSVRAQSLRDAGFQKVLFACGGEACSRRARAAAERMRSVGLEVRVALAPGASHTYLGEVAVKVGQELDWLRR